MASVDSIQEPRDEGAGGSGSSRLTLSLSPGYALLLKGHEGRRGEVKSKGQRVQCHL